MAKGQAMPGKRQTSARVGSGQDQRSARDATSWDDVRSRAGEVKHGVRVFETSSDRTISVAQGTSLEIPNMLIKVVAIRESLRSAERRDRMSPTRS